MRHLLLAFAALLANPAHADNFAGTYYDPVRDELVVDIVYDGTHPNHDFSLLWDQCNGARPPFEVAARLIDKHGDDAAAKEFRVRRRFSLEGLKCRPARVALRLDRYVTSVFIPARQPG
jgi:hypothetical protein